MKFIFAAGLILLLGGLIMVLKSAFEKRFLWGMGLLILPVLVPVYAKFHWLEPTARNGFLITIIGTLVVIAALYGGAAYEIGEMAETVPDKRVQMQVTKLAQQVPTAGPSKEPLPNEAEAAKIHFPEGDDYDPLYGYEDYSALDIEPLPSRDSISFKLRDASIYRYRNRQIGFDELEQHLGKPLRITTKEGQIKEGKLIESNRQSLSLEMPYEDGFVAFEYKLDNIDTMIISELVVTTPNANAATQVAPASLEIPAEKPAAAGISDGDIVLPEDAPSLSPVATEPAPANDAIPQQAITSQGTVLQIPYPPQHETPEQDEQLSEGSQTTPESTKIQSQKN